MTRFLLALLLTGLSGAAWGQNDIPHNPPTGSIPGLESNLYRHTRVLPHPYTLDEIDRMRAAIHAQFVKEHGQTFSCDMSGKISGYCPETYPQASTIEDLLNTYMSQGVRPEELEAKVK